MGVVQKIPKHTLQIQTAELTPKRNTTQQWIDSDGERKYIDEMKNYNIRLYVLGSYRKTITVKTESVKLLDKVPIPRHMRRKIVVVISTGDWIDSPRARDLTLNPDVDKETPELSSTPDYSDSDLSDLSDLSEQSEANYTDTLEMENIIMGVWEEQSTVPISSQNLRYHLEKGNEIIMCSDGSVSDDFQTGTYGWVVAAIHCGVAIPVLTGAGKCRTQDNIAIGNLDSTRMESIGLVSAIRAIKSQHITGEITLVCDNSAAVDTYNDHRNMNMREWQKLENKDVWGYLDTFQTKRDRLRLEVHWHRGHPEKRMEKSEYEPLDQANVWADALATAAYSRNIGWCKPWELPTMIPQVVCYEGAVITSDVTTTIRKYIMRTAGEMYSENHKHIVDLQQIDRIELDRLEHKLKSPRLKLAHVRRMWEIYPTNGYLNERDKRYHKKHVHHPGCHCGQHAESFTHMAYECNAQRMTTIRQLAICRLHDILDKHMPILEQSKWAIFILRLFNIEDKGTIEMWEQPTQGRELPNGM